MIEELQYCGAGEHREFQLYLAIEDIEHTKTKAKSPQTNGICERFHRTMQDEFYATAFRKKIYQTIDDLQADIDVWLKYYNEERPHTGKHCYGKTPMQTWEGWYPSCKRQITRYSLSKFCIFAFVG
ncbi:hypothetical protein EZS27_040402 [termite gut metagenome]|uniref:Integrase catalytic domain-containing protein n=1 Tax=termite gut metagenome TaxID=433724 RepID=A0A5J4PEL5_9ZZZZ